MGNIDKILNIIRGNILHIQGVGALEFSHVPIKLSQVSSSGNHTGELCFGSDNSGQVWGGFLSEKGDA